MTALPVAPDRDHFPVLDSLRAVGAMAVLVTHTAFWAGTYTGHGVWGTLLARLDVGVALFFVLSGFLLSRQWLTAAAEGRSAPPAGPYLWRRTLRVLPVYAVAAVLALALVRSNADQGPVDWLTTLLLLDTFLHPQLPAGLTQMWSLAVEATFYLLLPLLMVLGLGRPDRPGRPRRGLPGRRAGSSWRPARLVVLLTAMVATSIAWHLWLAPLLTDRVAGQPGQWLPAYLSWFAGGIGLALVHELHRRGEWRRLTSPVVALGRQPGVCWSIAAGLLLLSATPLAGPSMLAPATAGEGAFKNLAYAGVGTVIVLTGVFCDDGLFRRAFSARLPRHLGLTSYSLFCLHLPVLHLVMWMTGWQLFAGNLIGIFALTAALSLAAAEVTYRVVERPAMRLRGWRPGRQAATSTASTEASTR